MTGWEAQAGLYAMERLSRVSYCHTQRSVNLCLVHQFVQYTICSVANSALVGMVKFSSMNTS